MTVTISRSHWLRAEGIGMGRFCDGDGNYCALGFLLRDVGLSDEQMSDKGSLIELHADIIRKHVPHGLYEDLGGDIGIVSNDTVARITDTNDDPTITDAEREQDLGLYFSRANIGVIFTE